MCDFALAAATTEAPVTADNLSAEDKAVVESELAKMRAIAEKSTSLQELVEIGRQAVHIAIAARKRHNEALAGRLSEVALLALTRASALHKLGEFPCPDEQLSLLLELKGDLLGAIEHEKAFVDCIEAGKKGPASLLRLAKLCQSAGKLEEAVRYLNSEVGRDATDIQAFEVLYEIAATQGSWSTAAHYAIRGQQAALTLMSECATEVDFKKNVGFVLEAPNAVSGFPQDTVPSPAVEFISERLAKSWSDVSDRERVKRAFVFASQAMDFVRKYEEAVEKQVPADTDEGKQALEFIKIFKKVERLKVDRGTPTDLEAGKVPTPP
jgi:tetratricopeptide (TPR) repeat protein